MAVTLLAVFVAFGRLRRERTRSHLTLACGFTVICLSNLLFCAIGVPGTAGPAGTP